MIEEIDSKTYVKHYFEKVLGELGGDPAAFLQAAMDFVRQETDFLSRHGSEAALQQLLGGGAAKPAAAPAAVEEQPLRPAAAPAPVAKSPQPAVAAPAAAPAAEPAVPLAAANAAQQAQQEEAGPSAAEEAQQPGPEEEGEETESSKGLKPNAGNGADLAAYSWTQSLQECVVSVPVPAGTKGRMCDVQIGRTKLRVGVKGQPPVLDGELFAAIKPDDCLWNLVDGKVLEITLQKADSMQWWRSVVKGEPEIDTQAVEPESSKLADLDPEMRATVEKMMFDQRQKALGRPTSDEQHKAEVMAKFMAAHPELDFSNAKFQM